MSVISAKNSVQSGYAILQVYYQLLVKRMFYCNVLLHLYPKELKLAIFILSSNPHKFATWWYKPYIIQIEDYLI